MADLVIEVCEGRGGIQGADVKICNLVDMGSNDVITKKYQEALDAYALYKRSMEDLQDLFESRIKKKFIMIGAESPVSLSSLAEQFGVNIYTDLSDEAV